LIGAIAAVLAVEAGLERLDMALTRTESIDWRRCRRAAKADAPRADVLCLGTSMVQEGVLLAVIERRTGRTSYNLAVCAGRVSFYYYMLRRALAAGARPSAVLVDVHPSFVTGPYRPGEPCWSEVLGPADVVDLAWATREPRILTATALGKALASVRNRHQIRKGVVDAFASRFASMWLYNVQHLRNVNRNDGALVGTRNPNYDGGVSEVYRTMFLGPGWRCHPHEELYLRRFLDLAAAHGITVYWLIMPMAPALQQAREAAGLDAAYDRFVRSFDRYPNLVVVDGRRSAYDRSVFLDACHLDPQGAFVFTEGVAEVLRRRGGQDGRGPGGLAWYQLPRYRERPIDVPMEDIQQSGLAVMGLPPARR
jgi:hypothetical protein